MSIDVLIRPAQDGDLDDLIGLEQTSFEHDRISRRRLKHWIGASNGIMVVAREGELLLGYGLVLLNRGTRLARLYSVAVSAAARGKGIGRLLLEQLERQSSQRGRLYMRLEVARDNTAAIRLYRHMGYVAFGIYEDYYEDHQDALRMQKVLRYQSANFLSLNLPWYEQTTDFTCGPAAAIMAMGLDPGMPRDRLLELDIWREATTIFMQSGHGGTHPIGMALAMRRRGFHCEVHLNQQGPLFTHGVRLESKREVMALVDEQFNQQAAAAQLPVIHQDVGQQQIADWVSSGAAVIVLISTYHFDRKKVPHWVVVAGVDDRCLYVHDPNVGYEEKSDPPLPGKRLPLDSQFIPILREDFHKMSEYGRERLRVAIVVRRA